MPPPEYSVTMMAAARFPNVQPSWPPAMSKWHTAVVLNADWLSLLERHPILVIASRAALAWECASNGSGKSWMDINHSSDQLEASV